MFYANVDKQCFCVLGNQADEPSCKPVFRHGETVEFDMAFIGNDGMPVDISGSVFTLAIDNNVDHSDELAVLSDDISIAGKNIIHVRVNCCSAKLYDLIQNGIICIKYFELQRIAPGETEPKVFFADASGFVFLPRVHYDEHVPQEKPALSFFSHEEIRSIAAECIMENKSIFSPAEVTKFEVYATDAAIPAGTVDDVTGLAYSVAVPAGMVHKFQLRTDIGLSDVDTADIVVDWGDSTTSTLADYHYVDQQDWAADGECNYTLRHKYSAPGRYIVTIHGKDYWGIRNPLDNPGTAANEYILSRCFAPDLPLASCVTNLASFCRYSRKILKVHAPTGLDLFANIHNAYGVFDNCVNLVEATGLKTKFRYARDVSRMFSGCNNMTTCDFELPNTVIKQTGYDAVFKYCYKLTADISKLIPGNGFANRYVRLCETFSQCPKLTGTVRADMLWEDTSKVWSLRPNTEYQLPFEGCSDAVRSQVPVSWGGTMEWTPPPKNAVVDALPDNPDENTIYFITGE